MDRHAKGRLRVLLHSGEQGNRDIPAFPAQWLERLMSCAPRGALHYCPRRLADDRCAGPVGPPHHRNTWRTDPGRQDHTILPYADCTGRVRDGLAHGCPPCKTRRADAIGVHRRPARVRDDRDTPLFLGPGCATHTSFPKFGKVEYFR